MTALVAVETVLLVLLVVLVAGLLRSHAEILRRLGPAGSSDPPIPQPESARHAQAGGAPAPALTGLTPSGDAVSLSFEGDRASPTLLAFLTSGCSTCAGFWQSLGERRLPAGVETVIVAHGSDRERTARLRELAPAGVAVVMSSRAWQDYRVPGSPYFVLVDRAIRGEGSATGWSALASLVTDAIGDHGLSGEARGGEAGDVQASGGEARTRRIEDTLAKAGIGPGHPSLYPGRAAGATSSTPTEASIGRSAKR